MTISHISGDVTELVKSTQHRVVAHIVNDAGKYGAGVSGAIAKAWPEAEEYYRRQYKAARHNVKLGCVLWTGAYDNVMVAQMVAQRGVRSSANAKPIRYDALEECLTKLARGARVLPDADAVRDPTRNVSIHMPRIGSSLAGGDWGIIEPLIDEVLWDLQVFIYTPK